MTDKKRHKLLSTLAARATATVSVALVLMIVGFAGCAAFMSDSLSKQLNARLGFVVVLNDTVSAASTRVLVKAMAREPYAAAIKYVSPADALSRWMEATGDDDDIVETLGANPFSPELEVKVRGSYANADSIARIAARLTKLPQVSDIRAQGDMIEQINRTTHNLLWIAVGIAVLLAVIAVALINNMVRLSIYSRRFIVNTMQLVGATRAYVRRPFVTAAMIMGLIAGVAAAVVVCGLSLWMWSAEPMTASLLHGWQLAAVLGCVILLGIAICAVSAILACNRYMSLDRDNLYR